MRVKQTKKGKRQEKLTLSYPMKSCGFFLS